MLLSYVLAVALLATLAPFEFAWPSDFQLDLRVLPADVLLNLLMLFPAGFLQRLSARRRGNPGCLDALLLGLTVSLLLETAQLFIPLRHASPIDVVANSLGAWGGAQLHRLIGPWFDRHLAGHLTLRLPMASLLYLAMPALWLNGLAAEDPTRLLLSIPLGAVGSGIAVGLWRHRAGSGSRPAPRRPLLFVAVWFSLATAPAFFRAPALASMALGFVLVIALLQLLSPSPGSGSERRFELPTVRRLVPFFLVYLAGMALWPWQPLGDAFRFSAELSPVWLERRSVVLELLEYVAAFTMAGYLGAELMGRRQGAASAGLMTAAAVGLCLGCALEALRGFHPDVGANLGVLALVTAGALWGGAIYRSQLASVRILLERVRQTAPL